MSDDKAAARVGRRALLRRAVALAATGVLAVATLRAARAADEKLTQKEAEYQPTPKNGQSCATCQFFTKPAACKIVKGAVSPQGWCSFFATKTP